MILYQAVILVFVCTEERVAPFNLRNLRVAPKTSSVMSELETQCLYKLFYNNEWL